MRQKQAVDAQDIQTVRLLLLEPAIGQLTNFELNIFWN